MKQSSKIILKDKKEIKDHMDPIKSKQQDDLFNHKKKYTYCKWFIFQIEEKKHEDSNMCCLSESNQLESQMC